MSSILFADHPCGCKLPSPAEMAEMDRVTIDGGVSGSRLMDLAGAAVVQSLLEHFPVSPDARVVVLCGPGNNGGDGLVVARLLNERGFSVSVIAAAASRYSQDFLGQAHIFLEKGGRIAVFGECGSISPVPLPADSICGDELQSALQDADIVVDACLGTGQRQPPRGAVAKLINAANEYCRCTTPGLPHRVSIDIPSGVDADTGAVYEPAFKADITFAIELVKRGMVQYPARSWCGRIHTVSIGIDTGSAVEFSWMDNSVCPCLPERAADFHKGSGGNTLVIGGTADMPGAPVLTATSALRSGASLVVLAHLERNMAPALPAELMLAGVTAPNGIFEGDAADRLEPRLAASTCIALGPGLGLNPATGVFVIQIINLARNYNIPVVIDADGLNLIACESSASPVDLTHCVLTPHPGEMARLLKSTPQEVQKNRYAAARSLAQSTGAVVVLKGAATVVYCNNGGWVNSTGNPYMATAGSGDVLTGVIAALISQGLTLQEAACLGVYAHGRAGDIASSESGGCIVASEIINQLPRALRPCQSSRS